MFSFNLFLNKNRDFLHLLGHFSEIPSVGFHPLGSIRCQRCREVDLEGHWVQLRAHLNGFKSIATICFFKIFLKKLFFSLIFSIKETRFSHIFGISVVGLHHVHHGPSDSPWLRPSRCRSAYPKRSKSLSHRRTLRKWSRLYHWTTGYVISLL